MAAYRRVYDSHHLQADCQEPGSAPRTLRSFSSMGCLFYLSLAKVEGDRMRLIRKFSKLKETRPTGPGAPTVCRYQWSYMYRLHLRAAGGWCCGLFCQLWTDLSQHRVVVLLSVSVRHHQCSHANLRPATTNCTLSLFILIII